MNISRYLAGHWKIVLAKFYENQFTGKILFSIAQENATQFSPFPNQISNCLAKYVYINDKDVQQVR